jgi:hypothetical protein
MGAVLMADLYDMFDSIGRLVQARHPGINVDVFKSIFLISLWIKFGHPNEKTNRRYLAKWQKDHAREARLVEDLFFECSVLQQLREV